MVGAQRIELRFAIEMGQDGLWQASGSILKNGQGLLDPGPAAFACLHRLDTSQKGRHLELERGQFLPLLLRSEVPVEGLGQLLEVDRKVLGPTPVPNVGDRPLLGLDQVALAVAGPAVLQTARVVVGKGVVA